MAVDHNGQLKQVLADKNRNKPGTAARKGGAKNGKIIF
jgi:hypothetical protein